MSHRKNLLFKTVLFAALLAGHLTPARAQTAAERQQIKAAYQAAAIKTGRGTNALKQQEDSIKVRFQQADARVKNYLQAHPGQARTYSINGKLYYIQDIEPNGKPLIITTKDLECSSVIKSTSMYSGGSLSLNISGQNMIAGVWDGGRIRATHELFQNRAIHKDTAQRLSDHMAHVAGDLMGGDIAANRAARGIAFNATAWCYYWDYDAAEYSQFGSDGYLVSNHSYGRGNTNESQWVFGAYNYQAKNVDAILALRPNYLQVWAGGNEQQSNNNTGKNGYDVITGESAAKNILCVGALNANGTMSNFSNWGPTDDGRIKPDICAKGVGLTSAYSGADNQYNTGNGTSYASPSVAGLALLLQQYYKTLNPEYMEAAGLRGLMMHTATDLGQPGPDYKFGWGMANGEKASQTIMTANADFTQTNTDSKLAKITTNPAVGADVTYTVKAKGGTPLSVSVSWTDDAGPQQDSIDGIDVTTVRLAYNFDIKVTAPDGITVFYPWSGPGMANRTANATRTGPNNVDNFRRVDIDAPVADGVYTITITKRPGSPAADRAFTLIATGLRNTAPEINFSQLTGTAAEATTATTGTCVYYKDYTFSMAIANAPAGDATVTLAVDATSTAAEGKHFDVTTNGVFGAGSSKTLTFANGATVAQNYTVRVYDDAIVNPNETIQLSFTTTGGNATVGKNAAKTVITIADNDDAITVIAPATVTVGNNSSTITNAQTGPFSKNFGDLLMDHYFTAAELTAAGLVGGSQITGLTLNIAVKQSTTAYPNFNIRMGHISAAPTAASAFINSSSYTSCYSNAAYSTVAGDNSFAFTTAFVWNGTDNVAVRYCYNGTVDRSNIDFDQFTAQPNALGTDVKTVIYNYEQASANADGCALPTDASVTGSTRPVTRFTYTKSGTPIETTAVSGKIENLNSTSGQYNFYSTANKLVASIAAPSQNGACTEAKIEAAGTGFISFSGGQRSNKVWKITPSDNAATNNYTVTLYLTAAELAGQNPANLKIFKSSAADVASISQANTTTAATTVTSNSEYTSFTASFTGFSLFTIGTPSVILPLQLVSFSGNKQLNANLLEWKTRDEKGVKSFELETSINGGLFIKLATINANGSGNNSYHYSDANTNIGSVFYRLKIVDADGKFTYSQVVMISANASSPAITLFPTPAKDVINISTVYSATYKKAALYTTDGRLLQNITINSSLQRVNIQSLAKGVYLLKFENGEVLRFVKE